VDGEICDELLEQSSSFVHFVVVPESFIESVQGHEPPLRTKPFYQHLG
jgi:hypothetical protein